MFLRRAHLFSGTIASNLRYADENASDEDLKLAADISQSTEFISAKPEGMQTEIAQGGMNVSGGQKQRLSIAACPGQESTHLYLRRQLLGPGFQNRRGAAQGAQGTYRRPARC